RRGCRIKEPGIAGATLSYVSDSATSPVNIIKVNETGMDTDYIVIGSGIAGLRAALDLAPAGRVTIFTKAEITESNSMYAQGGIAAAIGPDDDIDKHYRDTIAAGAGLCDSAAVRVLVEEGPHEIEQLLSWGADF